MQRQPTAKLIQQAQQNLRDKQPHRAAQFAESALAMNKRETDAWHVLALAKLQLRRPAEAAACYRSLLSANKHAHGAAIELADLLSKNAEFSEALALCKKHAKQLPPAGQHQYLAAQVWSRLGQHQQALQHFARVAKQLPSAHPLHSEYAAAQLRAGHVTEAADSYRQLLAQGGHSQRTHFEYSKLTKATDTAHIEAMQQQVQLCEKTSENSVFLKYAIGKEYEDLTQWSLAFENYRQGSLEAREAASKSGYSITQDLALFDCTFQTFDTNWFAQTPSATPSPGEPRPLFVTGLPRSGTTLIEQILAAHSQVTSADETFFFAMAVNFAVQGRYLPSLTPAILNRVAAKDIPLIRAQYLKLVAHRVGRAPVFVEKLPLNVLHLGLISKAFPEAQILMTNRNPMDNGMALFKQPYFPFSYDLNELARYFVAYSKLQNHWQALVPNLYVQNYETLVREPRKGIEALLQHCNLPFEDTCFHFYNHSASSTSASAAQVREKPHTRSVGKWKRWTQELAPLQTHLDLNHIQYDQ